MDRYCAYMCVSWCLCVCACTLRTQSSEGMMSAANAAAVDWACNRFRDKWLLFAACLLFGERMPLDLYWWHVNVSVGIQLQTASELAHIGTPIQSSRAHRHIAASPIHSPHVGMCPNRTIIPPILTMSRGQIRRKFQRNTYATHTDTRTQQ